MKGLKCRECGRGYPTSPVHVCEFCFGPLDVDYGRLVSDVTIRPSLGAFDRALADVKSKTGT